MPHCLANTPLLKDHEKGFALRPLGAVSFEVRPSLRFYDNELFIYNKAATGRYLARVMEVSHNPLSTELGVLSLSSFQGPRIPPAIPVCLATDQVAQLPCENAFCCPSPEPFHYFEPNEQLDVMSAETIISRIARGADLDAVRSMLSKRPTTTNSISNPHFDPATVHQDAQETRIVVHGRYPQLVEDFLEHKRKHGASAEKELYSAEDWTWEKQVARLGERSPSTSCDCFPSPTKLLRPEKGSLIA